MNTYSSFNKCSSWLLASGLSSNLWLSQFFQYFPHLSKTCQKRVHTMPIAIPLSSAIPFSSFSPHTTPRTPRNHKGLLAAVSGGSWFAAKHFLPGHPGLPRSTQPLLRPVPPVHPLLEISCKSGVKLSRPLPCANEPRSSEDSLGKSS